MDRRLAAARVGARRMRTSRSGVLLSGACLAIAITYAAPAWAAQAQDWGCYDPQPGHPTPQERQAFLAAIKPAAQAAERTSGPPAAALAAMAVVESGYGFTRTGLEANNLYGWKYNSKAAAGGRGFYTLTCQPPEDVGNRYIKFATRTESIGFVAGKLAALSYYRADTEAYRQARAANRPVKAAVDAWIDGISDPYNWRPAQYAATIKAVMAANDLYPWSGDAGAPPPVPAPAPSPSPAPAPAPGDALRAAVVADFRHKITGRYMEQGCAPAAPAPAGWTGFPVQRCAYRSMGVNAVVYLLDAPAEKLAAWTLTACADAGAQDMAGCAKIVARQIAEASNAQFPVAGYVIEPASSGGGQGEAAVCYLFRDGVTVRTASSKSAPGAGACQPDSANDEPLTKAMTFARISSTTREMYLAAGGTGPVDGLNWPAAARRAYQAAWSSDRNLLISAWARSAKRQGTIH